MLVNHNDDYEDSQPGDSSLLMRPRSPRPIRQVAVRARAENRTARLFGAGGILNSQETDSQVIDALSHAPTQEHNVPAIMEDPLTHCGRDSLLPRGEHCCACCEELCVLRRQLDRIREIVNEGPPASIREDDACSDNSEMFLLDPEQQSQSVLSPEEAKQRGIDTSRPSNHGMKRQKRKDGTITDIYTRYNGLGVRRS